MKNIEYRQPCDVIGLLHVICAHARESQHSHLAPNLSFRQEGQMLPVMQQVRPHADKADVYGAEAMETMEMEMEGKHRRAGSESPAASHACFS